jgi:hypothetical protein
MTIQGQTISLDSVAQTLPPAAVRSSAAPVPAPVPSPPAATATISPSAELLNKLQHLHESSPGAFKRLVGHMADTVQTTASKSTGDEKHSLTKLADQLAQLAKTGQVSVFRPTHHRHPHRQAAPGVSSSLQVLLEQVDHVLGPAATPSSQT